MGAMALTRIPRMEIESLAQFDAQAASAVRLDGWTIQSVDLRDRSALLDRVEVRGALFLGCSFAAGEDEAIIRRGGLVFPQLPGTPFNPYRSGLYAARDLYDTAVYPLSLDARTYAWFMSLPANPPVEAGLAMTLHDSSVVEALQDWLTGAPEVVGVMGGHAVTRSSPAYAQAAGLGAALARRGLLVATGGGPGAMEAVNLGARSPDDLPEILGRLAAVPDFGPSVTDWAGLALRIEAELPSRPSLGIPTWYYGHEPPNVFASAIAKLFSNAVREDLLLSLARAGIVYLPGAAGTVQEVFQAATRNYYAADQSMIAPMIFFGRDFWSKALPAPDLLMTLARGRAMAGKIHLVDTVEEAVACLDLP